MEYIFRAKTAIIGAKPGSEMWVQGDLVHIDDTTYINVDKLLVRVDPQTVGQYIGVTDKNGVNVFDGDIIRAIAEGEEEIYTVEWCGDRKYPAFDLKPQIDCDGNGLSYLLWVEAEIEVIGNVHDNPELLQEE